MFSECEVIQIKNIPVKNNIQKFRQERGITQDELAKILEVSRAYLCKMENQRFSPGPGLMQKVCTYFSKELGEVFFVGGEEKSPEF
ncbi:MAG: putative transcriptional regulator [Eubacterium sp.]|jgi:putative transcriptional regulator|nr:putative transcriptional regulator [Eubacterium sp.]